MKWLKQALLCLMAATLCATSIARAQESQAAANAIETLNVTQQGGAVIVKLGFRGALSAPPAGFSIAKPARIALDFAGTQNGLGKTSQTFNEGDLRSVNIVQADDRTRLVFNLNKAMSYETKVEGKSLFVILGASARQSAAPQVTHFAESRQGQEAQSIRDISFRRGKNSEARITVDLSEPNAGIDIRQQGQSLLVDFIKVAVPEKLRKRLDVTDFATPVTGVSTVQLGENARMTITPHGLWEHNAYQTDTQFVIEVKPVAEDPNKLVQGSRGGYQGEKLSLNFQNVDVRRLLQVIGEFTGLNMVISESVSGAITLILKDVPWDQALDIILQQKGLDMRKNGSVILIAPREELAVKEKLEFETRQQMDDLDMLRQEQFVLSYAQAADLEKLIKGQMTKRGKYSFDQRSNILFLSDTPSKLEELRKLIQAIDVPVRQVLIEARVVEANDTFNKELGVKLGALSTRPVTLTGGDGGVQLGGGVYGSGGQTSSSYGNVNLPSSNSLGTLAFSLFNASQTRILNVELSAAEGDGRSKTISSPRVLTTNNVKAKMMDGKEVPYVTPGTSTSPPTVAFKDAKLILSVTPQITPEGQVRMKLNVIKAAPDTGLVVQGNPALKTTEVDTDVLVENGGTVVIGGAFITDEGSQIDRVPLLGDLPYVGFLFKHTTTTRTRRELLIFISPRIVSEALSIR